MQRTACSAACNIHLSCVKHATRTLLMQRCGNISPQPALQLRFRCRSLTISVSFHPISTPEAAISSTSCPECMMHIVCCMLLHVVCRTMSVARCTSVAVQLAFEFFYELPAGMVLSQQGAAGTGWRLRGECVDSRLPAVPIELCTTVALRCRWMAPTERPTHEHAQCRSDSFGVAARWEGGGKRGRWGR